MKCAVLALCVLAGCAAPNPNCIVAGKATVFGLDISTDPVTQVPHVRFGLVRYFYQQIPTSTNPMYAAPYEASTDAQISGLKQEVHESFNTIGSTNNLTHLWSPLGVRIRLQ